MLARPRLVNRIKGPIVEWAAFQELDYTLFAVGIYLILWGLYIAYFYVCGQYPTGLTLTNQDPALDDYIWNRRDP